MTTAIYEGSPAEPVSGFDEKDRDLRSSHGLR
jgi:hypothetical protein